MEWKGKQRLACCHHPTSFVTIGDNQYTIKHLYKKKFQHLNVHLGPLFKSLMITKRYQLSAYFQQ